MSRQIRSCCVVIFLTFVYLGDPFAFGSTMNGTQSANGPVVVPKPKINKKDKKIQPKPLKPLTEKDIQRANKKALEAGSGKSIQKANQTVLRNQAKAIREANKKAVKANKALQKAHVKAVREAEKQARAEAGKKNTP